jgi:hypothetical protein
MRRKEPSVQASSFSNPAAGDEEIILPPGAVDLSKARALHGFELRVEIERPHVIPHEEVSARCQGITNAAEEELIAGLGLGTLHVVPDDSM